jgi:nicotinamide phosphoribosyltransferase
MFKVNPLLCTDGYKTSHHQMYPEGTKLVFSNFTPRSTKYMPKQAQDIVVFGIQYTVKYIHDLFRENFFSRDKKEVCSELQTHLNSYLGSDYNISHFEALHDLGSLPVEVRALEEGSIIESKIPILTIHNTLPEFYWLTNFLETLISTTLWKPMHSASMSYAYNKIVKKYALETDKDNLGFTDFQCHDFSMRGMQSLESAIGSALGFLVCSKGTDTLPVLQASEYYYGTSDVAFSVPASEHAVMTAYGKEDEIDSFSRILDLFPTGIVSMVSDQFDLWKVLTEYLPQLKDKIMAREGKAVFRPDSGDPADILCGLNSRKDKTYSSEEVRSHAYKGVIELLWETFGGTVNEQGYKVLDAHVGAIYGDSITLERAEEICERLKEKGFASTNVVFGVGSYSMGFATRDSQGSAVKATYIEKKVKVSGRNLGGTYETVGVEIFKDPITDDGTKKSAKGLLAVFNGKLKDRCTWQEVKSEENELRLLYQNGVFLRTTTLTEIRNKVNG